MKRVSTSAVFDILSHLRIYFQWDPGARYSGSEEPFRSELYSSDQMDIHGKILARSHKLSVKKLADPLLKRLDDNEKKLLDVRNLLVESLRSGNTITPAGEWLLDNFYLIEEQIVIARKHLPKGYSEALPYLSEGNSSGMPRVYDIVLEIISHSDGRVDANGLSSFIASYQTITLLSLGELWAIPIMLRLAVIENLRRVSGKIALDMIDHDLADYWAERMMTIVQEEPGNLILTIADMARSKPLLNSAFTAGFSRQLQGKGPVLALPLSWMEQQLSGMGTNSDELVRLENQKQAADQISVRNSIGTLRFLGAMDWRKFVETLSSVEQVLQQDVDGTYALMDFATRDSYRHVVEAIAKGSPLSEREVALKAIALAAEHSDDSCVRRRHVGYFLVDKGRYQTERAADMQYSLQQKMKRMAAKMPVSLYFLSVGGITLALAAWMCYLVHHYSRPGWLLLCFVGLLSVSGAAQLALSMVNWLCTIIIRPRSLPRMDFSDGIPEAYRSLVVVPTLLSGPDYLEELIEGLEIRFLANRERYLHFGLLTDFPDADAEHLPEDMDLLELAQERIAALNQKYRQYDYDIFFLFHRHRTWNAEEGKWMGYERKRGKLSDLNALLRGKGKNAFSVITGNYKVLESVKYVITLDSDTQLPRDAAWRFIATMAHPLNQPIYNARKKRVTEGYAILQPRVASSIPRDATTLYLHMQGNVSGIDPYTRVSSDVYQDLFGEGSYIGKGIYDVDVFERAVHGVFPENRILSHDLLEGCYARSGLLNDVLLYEDNPSQYAADSKRRHRWIRGDWQIGAWMLPFVPGSNGKIRKNKLSTLSRWKIFDNLRRSLVPLALTLLLLLGWTVLPFPWFWTLAVTIIVLLPVLVAAGWQLIHRPADLTFKAHLLEVGVSVRDTLIRFIFGIAVLPYEAYKYMDAIILTNWRMIVSRKKLLEWTPSVTASRSVRNDIFSAYRSMFIAPLLALVCTIVFLFTYPESLLVASPILVLWFLAPAIAWRLSRPEEEGQLIMPEEQLAFLHKTARKTWSFFEQFVTEEDNWLPPDNFQEEPVAVVAHRTSPTNMGLSLLANLTAYDFGYIPAGELLFRSNHALETMLSLERYKGHFYNWYDTLSLATLHPRYVSTVDSGNLAGHLLVLRQGLLALPQHPVLSPLFWEGVKSTALVALDYCTNVQAESIRRVLSFLRKEPLPPNASLFRTRTYLDELAAFIPASGWIEVEEEHGTLEKWLEKLTIQVNEARIELTELLPWLELPPAPEHLSALVTELSGTGIPSLLELLDRADRLYVLIAYYDQDKLSAEDKEWLDRMRNCLDLSVSRVRERLVLVEELSGHCEALSNPEYDFLLDPSTNLLRIGYNVEEERKDEGYYDLLASEARLGIFVGIAQGKLPQDSWFALGRLLTNSGGDPILLSWSGSMFEYLMPQLVMPSYEKTLLHATSKAAVKRQIEYGAQRGVPWGISESAYSRVDASLNYQYKAFGVPGIGLKRGLEDDLVIAPYATMMALMVSPEKACNNLQLMRREGFDGVYGFYEAVDYTSSRQPRGADKTIIRSYMVHHQGMGFLALAYTLLQKPMQQRFLSELRFQAALLLLQERIPRATLFYAHTADLIETHALVTDMPFRNITTPNTIMPEIQLLCNGRYQMMITNSGGGYSRWKDLAVTRWREDTTLDNRGVFCYIKDIESGHFWSNTYQPTLRTPDHYSAIFSQGHVEFHRSDYKIETRTEIVISPEDDTEMRRIRLTNRSSTERILEITSYAEIVMASQASDEAHPAFSNLFVQTEIKREYQTVFCTRRRRSEEEQPPWMFHLMDVNGTVAEAVSYETDRMQFVGRGRTTVFPRAMDDDVLRGHEGAVLDPILAIRYRIKIRPGQTVTIDLIYGISETRESCEALMHKYRDKHLRKRAFELSWTHNQVLLRQINATEEDAQLYDQLAASVIYPAPALRGASAVLSSNLRGQSGLWSHSVSGDLPIVLLHVYDQEHIDLVRQLVQAHAYWRLKGLAVDLVIWNEDHGSYRQLLQEQILGLITAEAATQPTYNKPGTIYVKSADQLSLEDRILFESVARVVLHDNKGTLVEQVSRHYTETVLPPLLEVRPLMAEDRLPQIALPDDLLFFNGTGGFSPDGKTYKIITDRETPAPWVNVIANPLIGTVVSESGSAYTWAVNAHEYRITPWTNDPVSDTGGEAFYIRDEETGNFWSPSPFPSGGSLPYIITHGFGYSLFEHEEQGIFSEMRLFVDKDAPVKFIVLKIKNQSGRERKLSATGFLEIILGDVRSKTSMHVLSEQVRDEGTLLFRNRYNSVFAERVTFFKVEGSSMSLTADRSEFIGRNRNLADPQAMYRKKLSGKTGAGLDACGALQVKFDMLDGAEKEIVFQIGNEDNGAAVNELIQRFSGIEAMRESLLQVTHYWEKIMDRVQITTPDPGLNIMANGWLLYQTIASRLFARSGFYQSGGAFGFRDQLQDVLALLPIEPSFVREQILLHASRQFVEGDVQHWWHPPEGRGVRTRCSDDLLWLPFVVSRYVKVTGDVAVLSVSVTYLEGRVLHPGEDSFYDLPATAGKSSTLYEHCVRAIRHSLQFGEHGLPLIGSGDWNDGMDRVGNKGRGESVWLGFFLYDVLVRFTALAEIKGDSGFAEACKSAAGSLQEHLEKSAWDGAWYKRAWFDNGNTLGSKDNAECRIDAVAQSWSVLSGAAGEARRIKAMDSLDQFLVRRDLKLIQLLDPAFDKGNADPGYIKGYVPGVRENGGQYSHAAIWALMAFAVLKDRDKVWELFNLILPLHHAALPEEAAIYKVEPYVMAADVYANETHKGRGGWTWYTGSSGWMYQFITDMLLGMKIEGDSLTFVPCFPLNWPSVSIVYQYNNASYRIQIFQLADGTDSHWKMDHIEGTGATVLLIDDDQEHNVEVYVRTGEK